MRVTYDSEAKAVYIATREGHVVRSLHVDPGSDTMSLSLSGSDEPQRIVSPVALDFDRDGNLLGIELLGVESAPELRIDPEDGR